MLPPTYLMICCVLMIGLDEGVPVVRLVAWPWTLYGIGIAAAGGLVVLLAHRQFVRAETPVKPFENPSALVRTGPYRFSRNPMYLGMLLILLGLLWGLGTLSPALVPPLFLLVIHYRFVRREELEMELLFRSDYLDYKHRVRRWI